MRFVYSSVFLFAYLTYIAAHLLFSLLLVPVLVVAVPKRFRDRIAGIVFSRSLALFVRGYFRLLLLYRVREISGLQRARQAGPVIYVANHRGRLDGFFVLSFTGSTAVVMKSSYVKLPLFRTFARYLDFVSVDRSSLQELNRTLQRCREVLAGGKSLLVFPEGTRAPGARMLPFKDFAFRLSQAADLPVVPVVVHTDTPVLGKLRNRLTPHRRFALTLRFLEPVRCAPDERPADFAERVRRTMAQQLRELDSGTEWEQHAPRRERSGNRTKGSRGREAELHS